MNINTHGLVAGLAQGLDKVSNSLVQAENIKNNRAKVRQEAEQANMQLGIQQQNKDLNELKIQEMEQKFKTMERERTKDKTFDGLRNFLKTGDTTHLNNSTKSDPFLQAKMSEGGFIGFTEKNLLSDEALSNMGYDTVSKDMIYPVILTGVDGRHKVVDMYTTMMASGYAKQFDSLEKSETEKRVNTLKERNLAAELEKNEATAKTTTSDANAYFEYQESGGTDSYKNWSKVKTTATERKGQYQKQIETFKRNKPGYTEEELNKYIDLVMKKSVLGVSANKEDSKDVAFASNQTEALKLVNSKEYDRDKAITLEAAILNDLPEPLKKSTTKAITDMTANHKMVVSIDRILKEADSGDVKIDKDAVANAKTYMDTIFGNETPQAFKNVDFNTSGGLLLAGFMKDISGTAVGVAEAERLSKIFQGGDLADEGFVKKAMKQFANESKENNKLLRDNNAQYLPDTVVKLTTYGAEESKEVIDTKPSKQIRYQGKLYNVDAKGDMSEVKE